MSVTERIHQLQAELATVNVPAGFHCVAVSKKVSIDKIQEAHAAGLSHFGESYWQEAQPKLLALADLPLTWHFIGRLQSNKCADIAQHFDWVLSVAHLRHAKALSKARRLLGLEPLNLCVQVNVDGESRKDGVALKDLPDLLEAIHILPQVRLRGLMLLPAIDMDDSFDKLAIVFQSWQELLGADFDTLSMGMSRDYAKAIAAGSTMIRVGSLLFKEPTIMQQIVDLPAGLEEI